MSRIMPSLKSRKERLRSIFNRYPRLSEAVRAAMRSRFSKADIIAETKRMAKKQGYSRAGISYALVKGGISRVPQRKPLNPKNRYTAP